MKKRTGFGALLAAGIIGAGIWTWSPLPSNPNAETLSAQAKNFDAEIIRDEWGVPHIYGQRDADTAFGLAFAHAEDDFETTQITIAATRGVLARYQGKEAAVTDYLVNLLDVWPTVNDNMDKIPDDVLAIADGYVAGINLYAAQNPDKVWPGLAPFTREDIFAGFIFKTPFFYGFDSKLLELYGDERAEAIALDPSGKTQAFHVGPKPMAERGSNGMAVSPVRSGDNITRLMINSHQPMTGPVAWYEAHTVSREGLDIQGGLFNGTPFVLTGFNKHNGWANTVSEQDLTDIYVLTVNPDNKTQYKLDGEWVDFEHSTAKINVKLFGPFAFKAKRKVLRSKHGPVIETDHGTYAVRYAGMGEYRQVEQYYRLGKTTGLDSFMEAMSLQALPSINYVYADKDGNIGLLHNAQYPNRKAGWDWSEYLPGDRSDLIWQGYRPFADVPRLMNPESGFVWNSNNDPTFATDGPDNLSHDDIPPELGVQTNMTNRAMRMVELGNAAQPVSRQRLLDIKFDTYYSKNSKAAKVVKDVLSRDWSAEPELTDALEHLRAWDMGMQPESRHAALGALTTVRYVTEKYTGDPSPDNGDAFREAVAYLNLHYGKLDPRWDEVNRLTRGDASHPIGGGPDILRAIYPAEMRDDGILPAGAGDTYIALVEWDENGTQSADVIHQYGSATLDETSPHYGDQAPLFAARKWRKAYMSEAEIRANAKDVYKPGER